MFHTVSGNDNDNLCFALLVVIHGNGVCAIIFKCRINSILKKNLIKM